MGPCWITPTLRLLKSPMGPCCMDPASDSEQRTINLARTTYITFHLMPVDRNESSTVLNRATPTDGPAHGNLSCSQKNSKSSGLTGMHVGIQHIRIGVRHIYVQYFRRRIGACSSDNMALALKQRIGVHSVEESSLLVRTVRCSVGGG
jgi:hypothetical protein